MLEPHVNFDFDRAVASLESLYALFARSLGGKHLVYKHAGSRLRVGRRHLELRAGKINNKAVVKVSEIGRAPTIAVLRGLSSRATSATISGVKNYLETTAVVGDDQVNACLVALGGVPADPSWLNRKPGFRLHERRMYGLQHDETCLTTLMVTRDGFMGYDQFWITVETDVKKFVELYS